MRPGSTCAAALHPPPLHTDGVCALPSVPVLKLAPGDADALRCKVVLLIELGNFEEAMKLVIQPPLAASMAFEKVRRTCCMLPQLKLSSLRTMVAISNFCQQQHTCSSHACCRHTACTAAGS